MLHFRSPLYSQSRYGVGEEGPQTTRTCLQDQLSAAEKRADEAATKQQHAEGQLAALQEQMRASEKRAKGQMALLREQLSAAERRADEAARKHQRTAENVRRRREKDRTERQQLNERLSASSADLAEQGELVASLETCLHALTITIEKHQQQFVRDCAICMDRQSNICFGPCGHVCTCESCSRSVSECPVCRVKLEARIRMFL